MSDKPKPKLRVVGKTEDHEQIVTPEDPIEVNGDVVQALEDLVARAKEGEIIGFAMALQLTDNLVSTDYLGEIVAYQTLGLLDELRLNILAEIQADHDD